MAGVEIHPAAQAELDAAIAWYDGEWKGLGLEFLDEVDRAIGKAAQQPTTWRRYAGMHGVHRLNIHRFPYCIVYRCRQSGIQVVAIAHQRRKPDYWRRRLWDPGGGA